MSSLIEVDWLPNWVSYTWTRSQSNSTFDDEPLLNHHNLFYLHSPNSENTCCSADFRQACTLHCDGGTVCLSCLIRLLRCLRTAGEGGVLKILHHDWDLYFVQNWVDWKGLCVNCQSWQGSDTVISVVNSACCLKQTFLLKADMLRQAKTLMRSSSTSSGKRLAKSDSQCMVNHQSLLDFNILKRGAVFELVSAREDCFEEQLCEDWTRIV